MGPSHPKLRRIKFFAWLRREAWMAKLVYRIKEYARGGPVLFGHDANSGLFGRVRGGARDYVNKGGSDH